MVIAVLPLSFEMMLYVLLLQLSFTCAVSARVLGRDTLSADQLIVDTGYAKYLGNFTLPYSVAYLGVPYAEPPVGNQRFRAPISLDTEELRKAGGVTDARSYPDFLRARQYRTGRCGWSGFRRLFEGEHLRSGEHNFA